MIRRWSITVAGRRLGVAALGAALAALLAGCAGLPMSGPVQDGLRAVDPAARVDYDILADSPGAGASPEEIVAGFLQAGAVPAGSGPVDTWDTAREYLHSSIRAEWKPTARVTVGTPRALPPTATPTPGAPTKVEYAVDPVAVVDDKGTYTVASGTPRTLTFTLARENGEWRITKAPDGIVLDEVTFATAFKPYTLMYWDSSYSHLVPDVRWFPKTNPASRIAQALVQAAPSSWLADSVMNAFPSDLSVASVRIDKGTAEVDLDGPNPTQSGTAAVNRMFTQLSSSLAAAGYPDVRMFYRSTPVTAAAVTPEQNTSPQPIVLTSKGFGLYSGSALQAMKPIDANVRAAKPDAIELLNPQGNSPVAAVRQGATRAVGAVVGGRPFIALDKRPGLVAPTIDTNGYIWSVPRMAPQAVQAHDVSGKRIDVRGAWPGASSIEAMQVSQDGTRMAAIISMNGRSVLATAGILREDGVPRGLTDPLLMDELPGAGVDLAWIDNSTLGALAVDSRGSVTLVTQKVGGLSEQLDAPENADSIAGGTALSSLRLHDKSGNVYVLRNSNWEKDVQGVTVLAKVQ